MKVKRVATALMMVASAAAHAGDVVGLTTFTAGTPAKSAEVNGNFNAVKTAVDDNHSRVTAVENINMGPRLTALEAQITPLNAQSASIRRPKTANGGRP